MIEMYKQTGFKSRKNVKFAENTATKEILLAWYEGTDHLLTSEEIKVELFC